MTSWKPPFEVEQGFEGSLKEIIKRAETVRSPFHATPLPTGSARYGTIDELFVRLQQAIAVRASLPQQTSALLTFWAIGTWFADSLPIAPGLAIIGPEFRKRLSTSHASELLPSSVVASWGRCNQLAEGGLALDANTTVLCSKRYQADGDDPGLRDEPWLPGSRW